MKETHRQMPLSGNLWYSDDDYSTFTLYFSFSSFSLASAAESGNDLQIIPLFLGTPREGVVGAGAKERTFFVPLNTQNGMQKAN